MSARKPGSGRGLDWPAVEALARDLPGVQTGTSYGTPALRVRGKMLARLKEDGETIVLATTFVDRDLLVRDDPSTFFFTDHYANYPLVLVRLASADAKMLGSLLEDAWRRVASKRVVAAYDAARSI